MEKAKIWLSIIIPIATIYLGYIVESSLGSKENIVEKRIEIYEKVGPLLNDIYVHVQHVGHWKMMSDEKAIAAKREADRLMNANRAFWSQDLFRAYQDYTDVAFRTYNGEGKDAQPKKPSKQHEQKYSKLMEKFNEDFR